VRGWFEAKVALSSWGPDGESGGKEAEEGQRVAGEPAGHYTMTTWHQVFFSAKLLVFFLMLSRQRQIRNRSFWNAEVSSEPKLQSNRNYRIPFVLLVMF